MNWSCVLQSTISDIEVTHVNVDKRTLFDIPGYRYLCVIVIVFIYLVDSCHSGICNKHLNLNEYFYMEKYFMNNPSPRAEGGCILMLWINKGKIGFLNWTQDFLFFLILLTKKLFIFRNSVNKTLKKSSGKKSFQKRGGGYKIYTPVYWWAPIFVLWF